MGLSGWKAAWQPFPYTEQIIKHSNNEVSGGGEMKQKAFTASRQAIFLLSSLQSSFYSNLVCLTSILKIKSTPLPDTNFNIGHFQKTPLLQ